MRSPRFRSSVGRSMVAIACIGLLLGLAVRWNCYINIKRMLVNQRTTEQQAEASYEQARFTHEVAQVLLVEFPERSARLKTMTARERWELCGDDGNETIESCRDRIDKARIDEKAKRATWESEKAIVRKLERDFAAVWRW